MHESVDLLGRYLRIDTSNPPGNEKEAARFFSQIFDHEGIEYSTWEPERGRISLRAVIPGSGTKGPLILLNHMDVVPASREDFSFDPFGGEIRDGYLCGRGALDMKGVAVMQLAAFLDVKRRGMVPGRDLVFLAVADEEEGGGLGAGYFMERLAGDLHGATVLNEGMFGLADMVAGRRVMMISPAEKGTCWLKLSRRGVPGHGSCPHGQNALVKLNEALSRLLAVDLPVIITPAVSAYFMGLAPEWKFLEPFALDGSDDTLARLLSESGMLGVPQLNAMVRNTISLNRMEAGIKTNVIPDHAEAWLDIRLLPGQDTGQFVDFVKETLADEAIVVEVVLSSDGSISPLDTDDYAVISDSLRRHFPDSLLLPALMLGMSDSRFFRQKGIPAYGFCPIHVPMEHLKMVHGNDEKISVEELVSGANVYTDIVRRLCS